MEAAKQLFTDHLYLSDTELYHCRARVTAISESEYNGEKVFCVITDRTVLHPQGGGQPTDSGVIRSDSDSAEQAQLEVVFVRKESRDAKYIEHVGRFVDSQRFSVGQEVDIHVDSLKRQLHARIHSAGHLLDAAFRNVDWAHLVPTKGYHFPDGPYVEYEGEVPAEKREPLIAQLNEECARLIKDATDVQVCSEEGWRSVTVCGVDCPCGGTHVKNVSAIGEVRVTRIKKSKKSVRVSYQLQP